MSNSRIRKQAVVSSENVAMQYESDKFLKLDVFLESKHLTIHHRAARTPPRIFGRF
jgi:hypothetical protein